jgi:hypothetical protein
LFTLFQRQVSHHRIEIDRMSAAAEDIVTVKVDMLLSDRRDFFREWPLLWSFLVALYLSILPRQLRPDGAGAAGRLSSAQQVHGSGGPNPYVARE